MPNFTRRLSANLEQPVAYTLALTAEERSRSRYTYETEIGEPIQLQLPRGTVLQHGDLLTTPEGQWLRIEAKPEPVLTVTGQTPLDLLRATYHLGNRHVPLEIKPNYLRLSVDAVLGKMLEQLGLTVTEELLPFTPEAGAYGHSH